MSKHLQLLAFLFLFTACGYHTISQPTAHTPQPTAGPLDQLPKKKSKSLNFVAVGDWGRNGYYKQDETGEMMGKVMQHLGGDFVISVGDNFYPDGVQSTQDYHWTSSFEKVYKHPGTYLDWWVVLGNHDYRGNVQAQIDYSDVSRRWNMPDRYYTKTFKVGDDAEALFVFIDTNPLYTPYLNDPFKKHSDVDEQDIPKQLEWIEQTLQNSQAKWKIVVGHHQLYTGGRRHGLANPVRDHLLPIFQRQQIDLYLCGHEHHLEYSVNQGLHQIITGAGSSVRDYDGEANSVYGISTHGFVAFTLTTEELEFHFIDHNGQVLHTNRRTKP